MLPVMGMLNKLRNCIYIYIYMHYKYRYMYCIYIYHAVPQRITIKTYQTVIAGQGKPWPMWRHISGVSMTKCQVWSERTRTRGIPGDPGGLWGPLQGWRAGGHCVGKQVFYFLGRCSYPHVHSKKKVIFYKLGQKKHLEVEQHGGYDVNGWFATENDFHVTGGLCQIPRIDRFSPKNWKGSGVAMYTYTYT